jgi:uncharacterized protein (TIGR02996 family)
MDMQAAFLADIAANAEDDAPRLVYADWLEENGDAERAAFIRAQCRLPKMGPCDPERFAPEVEAEELFERNETKWRKGLPRTRAAIKFARGFPYRFTFPVGKFLEHGKELLDAAPTLREYCAHRPGSDWDELMRSPLLGRLSSLDAGEAKIGMRRTRALAASPLAAGLRSLDISYASMLAAGLDALINSTSLAGLRRLGLRGNELGNAGLRAFAAAPGFPALVSLDIRDNGLRADGVAALARSPLARRLEELSIEEKQGGDGMVRAFALGDWPALRKLSLCLKEMTGPGIATLAACPSLSGLRELDLTDSSGQPLAPLFKSPHLVRLERLALNVGAAPGSMEALAESPMLANLRGLTVVNEPGVAAVLASPASAGLVELGVTATEGTPTVARAFGQAGHLTNLRKLAIAYPYHRDLSWLRDLLGGGHLAGVVHLDLSGNDMDGAALRALIDCPNLGGLRRLRLGLSWLHDKDKMRQSLKDRFGPALRIN